ncbi:tetratricopeptide repeat protein [Brevibacillus fulvus]|nr:tetratricopeptide repeat protein [Brevibacillus fulvus]
MLFEGVQFDEVDSFCKKNFSDDFRERIRMIIAAQIHHEKSFEVQGEHYYMTRIKLYNFINRGLEQGEQMTEELFVFFNTQEDRRREIRKNYEQYKGYGRAFLREAGNWLNYNLRLGKGVFEMGVYEDAVWLLYRINSKDISTLIGASYSSDRDNIPQKELRKAVTTTEALKETEGTEEDLEQGILNNLKKMDEIRNIKDLSISRRLKMIQALQEENDGKRDAINKLRKLSVIRPEDLGNYFAVDLMKKAEIQKNETKQKMESITLPNLQKMNEIRKSKMPQSKNVETKNKLADENTCTREFFESPLSLMDAKTNKQNDQKSDSIRKAAFIPEESKGEVKNELSPEEIGKMMIAIRTDKTLSHSEKLEKLRKLADQSMAYIFDKDSNTTINAYNGDKVAQYNLGVSYEQGIDVENDINQAKYWYTKSANQGYAPAQIALADIYYFNEKKYQDALYWYSKQTEDEYALEKCAVIYLKGLIGTVQIDKANEYFIKSADYGNCNAQYWLSINYLEGKNGLPQNIDLAYKYALMAYQKGNVKATYILGQLHNMNKFADTNASFKYFKEGAEKGVVLCQVELAWYYLRGYGTTRDWQKSEYWYRIAADNGNDYAKHVINEMEKYKDSGCQECGCPWIISVESEVYDYEDGNFIRFETQQYCQACDQRYFTT